MPPTYHGDLTPKQAWDFLNLNRHAILIDVRTYSEWNYVGHPDLTSLDQSITLIPWSHENGRNNPEFLDQIQELSSDTDLPLLFLCRSGGRSAMAAMAVTQAGYKFCYNITQGFEGGLDNHQHRGNAGGWKYEKLPWIQG